MLNYKENNNHFTYFIFFLIKQMYDQTAEAEISLMNTGRVGFEFSALAMDPGMAAKPKPGMPVMIPHSVSFYI